MSGSMLRMIIATILAISLSLSITAGELVDREDRFTQKRELKWISHVSSETPAKMGLTASIFFHPDGHPGRAVVHLAGSFERVEYASCHMTNWLADGEPVKPESNSYQALPRNDSPNPIEIVTSVFTISQLKKLAAAQLLEYRICRDEGSVPEKDHAGLRNLVSRL